MDDTADELHIEINRYVVLLRSEKNIVKVQDCLDEIARLNGKFLRLYKDK